MSGKMFVDTNIMVYAHDLDAGYKREMAKALMEKLWSQNTGVISIQVLQEFYVTVTQKIARPLSKAKTRGILKNYSHWQVELNGMDTLLSASDIQERYVLSFWDALIVAAAVNAGAEKILTEDLSDGQILEGVLIENPVHFSEF